MSSCTNKHVDSVEDKGVEYVDVLRDILDTQDKWVKVHAAEFLIWQQQDSAYVREVFLKEAKLYDTVPQYRVGIWRVLAQAATDQEERKQYIEKIHNAYQQGPDQLHALETLAKLKEPIGLDHSSLDTMLLKNKEINSTVIYGLWNQFYNPQVPRVVLFNRLLSILKDEQEQDVHKILVSYVFRFLALSPSEEEQLLAINYQAFPEPVQLQFLATLLSNVDLDANQYATAKLNLLKLESIANYYPTAILALSHKQHAENAELIATYYKMIADSSRADYQVDHLATAAYAYLNFLQ